MIYGLNTSSYRSDTFAEWGDQDLSSGTKWKNIKSQSYFSADALGTDVVFDYSLLFNYWQSQTRI